MTCPPVSSTAPRHPRVWVAWLLTAGLLALAAGGAGLGAATDPVPPRVRTVGLRGALSAPGGPYLVDRFGRVVLLHGVNVVYKRPPYEVYPDPGHAWNFTAADARRIASLGFDVVRLGILWEGLEPGYLSADNPSVCAQGRPGNPHQLLLSVVHRYLERLGQTVDLLARYHVYAILDMHQDIYSSYFGGEGAPAWAVCTDGVKAVRPPGRWSKVYRTEALDVAFDHFWQNNVVGNLQGQFDQVWSLVAKYFRHDPWVLGFDPFNEPFSQSVFTHDRKHFDAELECFYTGAAHVGRPAYGAPPIRCPKDDPRTGVIPTLAHADPHALIFFEPDIYGSRGRPTYFGPMPFGGLVYNVHIYCGDRYSTGNPKNPAECERRDASSLLVHERERPEMATSYQPGGPAWFVSEFGAMSDASVVGAEVALYDRDLVGWTYWSWEYYDDPTGSTDEALVKATGHYRPTVDVLSEPYAEATAGTPISMSYDDATGSFDLRYLAGSVEVRGARAGTTAHGSRATAPTLVVVPRAVHYRDGYCASVRGGRVVSEPDADLLEVASARRSRVVTVVVTAASSVRRVGGHLLPVCG